MKELLAFGGFAALICYAIWPDLGKNWIHVSDVPAYNWRNAPARELPEEERTAPAKAKSGKRVSAPRTESEPIALIKEVSRKYGVPAGALYGIWSKESSRTLYGWGDAAQWPLASDMVKEGGKCLEEYPDRKCQRNWRALQIICSQARQDGTPLCDPYEVRTSYALAMGPMQHMPEEIVRFDKKDRPFWSDRMVDYDGDGVVDPHGLPDAMAMAAVFLKKGYAKHGNWPAAVNDYFGSQTAGYMEGTTSGKAGVVDHWKVWCEKYEKCSGSRVAVAMNE